MKKVQSILNFLLLIIVTFVFSLFISCDDSNPEQNSSIPIDAQDIFPELGYDSPYFADSIYFGREKYIEYHSGSLPIILSAPHGGWIDPPEISDRTQGTTQIMH